MSDDESKVKFIVHKKIPVEMIDDPAVLNTVAHGYPYTVSKNLVYPDYPYAFMRVEYPDVDVFLETGGWSD